MMQVADNAELRRGRHPCALFGRRRHATLAGSLCPRTDRLHLRRAFGERLPIGVIRLWVDAIPLGNVISESFGDRLVRTFLLDDPVVSLDDELIYAPRCRRFANRA